MLQEPITHIRIFKELRGFSPDRQQIYSVLFFVSSPSSKLFHEDRSENLINNSCFPNVGANIAQRP
jgi:hypothetical protein